VEPFFNFHLTNYFSDPGKPCSKIPAPSEESIFPEVHQNAKF